MPEYKSTKEVARILGVNINRLSRALWLEEFRLPAKGPGGAFLWTDEDIERAGVALLGFNYRMNRPQVIC
jgi:hypothetical protein